PELKDVRKQSEMPGLIFQFRSQVLVLTAWSDDEPSHVQAMICPQTAEDRNEPVQPLLFYQSSHGEQGERFRCKITWWLEPLRIHDVRQEIKPRRRDAPGDGVLYGDSRVCRNGSGAMQVEPAAHKSALAHLGASVVAHRADAAGPEK